jgi:tRNA nucleotidyltransferase/poly(A) polymerase
LDLGQIKQMVFSKDQETVGIVFNIHEKDWVKKGILDDPHWDFCWLQRPGPWKMISILSPQGTETRFVGGAVRNTLLGLYPDDFDLATQFHPEEVMALLKKNHIHVIPTGIDHGTVTAVLEGIAYEITTLRRDIETDGRHARVAFTDSFYEDAQRRDFTMNALSLDKSGNIYDFFQGFEDIQKRKVRFIGNPSERIREDFLRILRFFRMNAWYGSTFLDCESLNGCIQEKFGLEKIAKERITYEFLKLLKAPKIDWLVKVLDEKGFLDLILGNVFYDCKGLERLRVIENFLGVPSSSLARLASLYPWALEKEHKGTLAENEGQDQRCVANDQHHPFPKNKSLSRVRLSKDALGKPFVLDGNFAAGLVLSGKQRDYLRCLMPGLPLEVLEDFKKLWAFQSDSPSNQVFQERLWLSYRQLVGQDGALSLDCGKLIEKISFWFEQNRIPEFPVTGKDVMALGLQGPVVGKALFYMRRYWQEHQGQVGLEQCLDHWKQRDEDYE